jgi:hypothetical protein
MNDEVAKAVEGLNRIQEEAISSPLFQRRKVKDEWRKCYKCILSNGLKPKKKVYRTDGRIVKVVWSAIEPNTKVSRNSECVFEYTDVRPNHKTLVGDCTTRAMAFMLKGIMTYDEIEKEQYSLARGTGLRRNSTTIWRKVLLNRGYEIIRLPRPVKRSVVAKILGGTITLPIATISSGHVAVVDVGGIVRDTWDSRGGKVKSIIAKKSEIENIVSILMQFGVECW